MGCNLDWLKGGSSNKNIEVRFLILGLDNSGKTSIMTRMKNEELIAIAPTIGLNIEHINRNGINITIWDIGGQATMLWRHYYLNAQAIIFVIDLADKERIQIAKQELDKILAEPLLVSCPILIFGNKQDLAGALTSEELTEAIKFNKIERKNKIIQLCSALRKNGIWEGIDRLLGYIMSDSQLDTKKVMIN